MKNRSWLLTVYNFIDYEEYLKWLYEKIVPDYLVGQLEQCPETGRLHIQAFLYIKKRISLEQLKKVDPSAHYETVKVERDDVIAYCGKEETKVMGPVEFGTKPKFTQKAKSLKAHEVTKIKNELILKNGPEWAVENGYTSIEHYDRVCRNVNLYNLKKKETKDAENCRGVWIHGKPGVGKTHYARNNFPDAYIKTQNKWWDGYSGEKYVILDDYDCKELAHYLKIWLDKWRCTGEIKGGIVSLSYEKFVITSNYLPREIFTCPVLIEAINRRCEFINL